MKQKLNWLVTFVEVISGRNGEHNNDLPFQKKSYHLKREVLDLAVKVYKEKGTHLVYYPYDYCLTNSR